MSSADRLVLYYLIELLILCLFSEIGGASIKSLQIPAVIRNGTGPVELRCIYEINENERGLIIKWYHELDQIYQWIPPLAPQDAGLIHNLAEYPLENLKQSDLYSTIRLKMVTVEMSGFYICTIETLSRKDTEVARMIVYVPETSAKIYVSRFNASHLNITCVVKGAQPCPTLTLYIDGIKANGRPCKNLRNNWYRGYSSMGPNIQIIQQIFRNIPDPAIIECEIAIPETDYKRRTKIVYYPTKDYVYRNNIDYRFYSKS